METFDLLKRLTDTPGPSGNEGAIAAVVEDVEESLAHDWAIYRGQSRLDWPEASPAARAAWERAKRRGRMMV